MLVPPLPRWLRLRLDKRVDSKAVLPTADVSESIKIQRLSLLAYSLEGLEHTNFLFIMVSTELQNFWPQCSNMNTFLWLCSENGRNHLFGHKRRGLRKHQSLLVICFFWLNVSCDPQHLLKFHCLYASMTKWPWQNMIETVTILLLKGLLLLLLLPTSNFSFTDGTTLSRRRRDRVHIANAGIFVLTHHQITTGPSPQVASCSLNKQRNCIIVVSLMMLLHFFLWAEKLKALLA